MKRVIIILLMALIIPLGLSARPIFKVEGNNVIIDLEGAGAKSKILKIEVWSNSSIKVVSGMSKTFSGKPSLVGINQPIPIKFKTLYSGNKVEITLKDMIINVEEDGLVRIFSKNGNRLIIESDRYFTPSTIEEGAFNIKQRFFLGTNEQLLGYGQMSSIRNLKFEETKQNSIQYAAPVLYSDKGYAIIWDNYSQTKFEDLKSGMTLESEVADEIEYFVIYGPEWDQIISEIRTISGKAPIFPYWSTGFWTSQSSNAAKFTALGATPNVDNSNSATYYQKELSNAQTLTKSRYSCIEAGKKASANYMQQRTSDSTYRFAIPTSTAFPGAQHYDDFLKAANIPSTWEGLSSQIETGLFSALTGQPYWSTCIGGSDDKCDPELLSRWYQFAAFTPIFQIDQNDKNACEWNENCKNSIFSTIQLRNALKPYIYTLFYKIYSENYTPMRALRFDYSNDPQACKTTNEYMFGNSFLVCPITEPNAKNMEAYLPLGNNWVNFWTGEQTVGGTSKIFPVQADQIPLFVKAGSILPFNMKELGNEEFDLLLKIYPGSDGSFTLYNDQKDGFGYKTGASSLIKFNYSEKDKAVEISAVNGSFEGMESAFKIGISIVYEGKEGCGMDTTAKTIVEYKGKKLKVKLS